MDTISLLIKNTIVKYRHLQTFLKLAGTGVSTESIIDDFAIMKSNCEFCQWYFSDGQSYSNYNTFKSLEEPCNSVFIKYYELQELLTKKPTKIQSVLSTKLVDSYNSLVKLKIESLYENIDSFIQSLSFFDIELTEKISPSITESNLTFLDEEKIINTTQEKKTIPFQENKINPFIAESLVPKASIFNQIEEEDKPIQNFKNSPENSKNNLALLSKIDNVYESVNELAAFLKMNREFNFKHNS